MVMKALRDRQLQQQQELSASDEMKHQYDRHSTDGAASSGSTVEKQIRLGLAQTEQLLSYDTLT